MSGRIYVASAHGLVIAERDGRDWKITGQHLESNPITSVAACDQLVLAGTRSGIWRSQDGGATWEGANEGLSIKHIRWLACQAGANGYLLAGTEPAGIYLSHDGGSTWDRRLEVDALRSKHGWYLP